MKKILAWIIVGTFAAGLIGTFAMMTIKEPTWLCSLVIVIGILAALAWAADTISQ